MPYHPPSQDEFTDVLRWFLVAVPDKPEYVRAAYGAYTEFTKYWMWDADVGDANAAADSWDEAVNETLRALEMGFPDDLLALIDEVEPLLKSLQFIGGCCDANDISGGTLYTDDVSDGVGNVPQNVIDAGYATGASDWAGFDDYKCMIAHVLVDDMEAKLRKLAPYIDAAGEVVGGIATVVGILTTMFTGGLTALAGGILAATGVAAIIYENITSGTQISDLADKVSTNHDDLACAFYDGTDGPDAAISALKGEIDNLFTSLEAIILKNLNIEPTARALYAGRYDAQDIAETISAAGYAVGDYDCTCALDYDFINDVDQADMAAGADAWTSVNRGQFGACAPLWQYANNQGAQMWSLAQNAITVEGYAAPPTYDAYVVRVETDICVNLGSGTLTVQYADGTTESTTVAGTGLKEWEPPNGPTKPTKNQSGLPGGIIFDGTPNAFNVTSIKVYWKIVAN